MIDKGIITMSKEKISTEAFVKKFNKTISPKGTLVMSFKLSIGKVSLLGIDAVHNEAIISIYPYCNIDNSLRNYLFVVLPILCTYGISKDAIKGATLNSKSLSQLLIPLPPKEEQVRIVKKIEELEFKLTEYDKLEKEDASLDTSLPDSLNKSILQYAIQGKLVEQDPNDEPASMLLERIREEKKRLIKEKKIKVDKNESVIYKGEDNSYYEKIASKVHCINEELPFSIPDNWSWARLSSICNIYTGNSINAEEKKKKYDGTPDGLPYIATKDVSFEQLIDYDNGVRIPTHLQENFRIANKNVVLLCIEGGSAGRKIGITDRSVCFGNKLCCFETYLLRVKYLFYALQTPAFTDNFKNNTSGIIGGVSVNTLKTLLIPIPPLEEQERIVERLERIRENL